MRLYKGYSLIQGVLESLGLATQLSDSEEAAALGSSLWHTLREP